MFKTKKNIIISDRKYNPLDITHLYKTEIELSWNNSRYPKSKRSQTELQAICSEIANYLY